MKPKYRRALGIAASLVLLGLALTMVLTTLRDEVVFFHKPLEITDELRKEGKALRLGGLVAKGSLQSAPNRQSFVFAVTDESEKRILVKYRGILPDLFREGQGVIADGSFDASGIFIASEVLAKHDEKYVPPSAARTPGAKTGSRGLARQTGRGEKLGREAP